VFRSLIDRRPWLLGLVLTPLIVAATVGTWLATRGGHSQPAVHRAVPHVRKPGAPTHAAYAALYKSATVRATRIDVLKKWPAPAYQTFRSGANTCYEWYDDPVALYTLCFSNGVLVDKAIS
jgi:hypothetical protein